MGKNALTQGGLRIGAAQLGLGDIGDLAEMAELVDAADLKSAALKCVWVRVPLPAPVRHPATSKQVRIAP